MLVQQQGFGGLREQVDDGNTSQAECFGRNPGLQAVDAFIVSGIGKQEYQFRGALEALVPDCVQAGHIHEEKLAGQRKELLQDAVADVRTQRVRRHALVFGKPHGLHSGRG